ncbi:MAG TPA: cyclase family protein [Candidatus Hydrogenedentes bacterium]|jgi:arylformamidase|nr:MAG: Kynurenine formamidase [Candidatus Hydrogenedentes bacterium ADurb.Bin170]HNZ48136.1 cyclase family protein [Candidatus Hydrogenedentota bacterium]HOD94328.1 cyclase family protein [Candidatus Hydrogenedentota bacterium]HOM48668.1 cyclase family protein [Candidatus Hydrogenedentota bacterium]HOR49989.1 cyclase family protein [Candidatus Hydrogenedentota bacterium]
MNLRWIDVTLPMHRGMTLWPGDPPFSLEADVRIARGNSCNVSKLSLGTHTGTHLDAPWHFIENGAQLENIDKSLFFGTALILDCSGSHQINAADLPAERLPERVLFKTANSRIAEDSSFVQDFTGIEADAAQRLVDDGVRLVGIDYLSIGPYKRGEAVHKILLGNGTIIVEGLRLANVPAGKHEFIVLPLRLLHADGAPCRAFVGVAG